MTGTEAIRTLTERRDYLGHRITAKRSLGWETQYDQRERDALTWALAQLEAA
jgi:hypothetical protein